MKRIGKYEIRGLLGKGGMSVVYKARLPVVDKLVALKLLAPHPHLVASWGEELIRDRFHGEARAIGALRHPNVVEVLDFDFADGRPFFTMEYYYQSLGTILGEAAVVETPCRALGLDRVIHYARQMLEGLARLHRAGVVHRDIKPYNLLVTEDDRLKICDFGLSRLRGETRRKETGGVIVGSPYYAAPEQERDPESVDPRADLYSVGVVICRMLTGLFPGGEGIRRIAERIEAGEGWRVFVESAVRPRVDSRAPSALHLLGELKELESGWRARELLECESIQTGPRWVDSGGQTVSHRSRPVKVSPIEAPAAFGCDALLRPLAPVRNEFENDRERQVVLDRSTGLLWELSGSPDPVEWAEALAHVDGLNRQAFAGHRSWRLPTVPEMLSLSRDPSRPAAFCDARLFDPVRRWFWTCDRKSFCAAWYVDTEMGCAGWSDRTCRYFVRGVADGPRA